ncbi:MAG: TonB-dependent receptor [Bacteroidales bacterium]|nr:TonB-dependent receptor [Bacteroidales bacterium]MBN2749481.1 TonB-dependent receptor [Bacteroidales bacterium]
MKRAFVFLVALMLLSGEVFSQNLTQSVRGVVVDASTGESLVGATVILVGVEPIVGTATNVDGEFLLGSVPVGRHSFKVSMVGYQPLAVNEQMVTSSRELNLKVELHKSVTELDAVVVSVKKDAPLNSMSTVSARQFTVEETQRYAGGLSDPARLASSFAGVATPSVSSNGISVRGNNPGGLLWRVEGVEIPNPNHFANLTVVGGGMITVLSNQMVANSDFFTGGFSAEYGNALSGVFDIKLISGNERKRNYTMQAGLLGIDFATEGPFAHGKQATYALNYRYSAMGLIAPFLPDDAGILRYQDFSAKLTFPTKRAGTFTVWGLAALDGIDMDALESTEWEANTDRDNSQTALYMYAAGLSHRVNLTGKSYLNTSVAATGSGLSHEEQRVQLDLSELPQSDVENNLWRVTLQSVLSTRFGERHSNRTGFYINRLGYNVNLSQALADGEQPTLIADQSGSSMLFQAFSQSRVMLTNRLSLNVGLHALYFHLTKQHSIEPRMGVKFDLTSRSSLGFAYGIYSRIEHLPVYFVRSSGAMPNKDLDLMKSEHFILSYNIKINDNLRFCVEPYFQQLRDIPVAPIGYLSTVNTEEDVFFNHQLVSKGSGHNVGVDFTLERFLSKGFYYLATASVFDSKYKAIDGIERNTRFNRNYVLNLLVGKEWQLGRAKNNILGANLRLNYMGGNRREPIDYAASLAAKDVVYSESGARAYSAQFDDMPVVSVALSFRRNKPRYSAVWTVQVLNALGTKEFKTDYYNLKTGTIDSKFDGVMVPNISYRVEF